MKTNPRKNGRGLSGRIARFGAYWINRANFRRMDELPEHVKRDIGWPPYGDLDLRERS